MAGALGAGARLAGAGGAGAGGLAGAASGLRGVAGAANGLVGSLKGLLTAVPDATKALTGLGQELAQYVRLSSPVAVQRLTLATEDLMAVMGRGLTPVLELVTKTIRVVADSMEPFVRVMHSAARAAEPLQRVVALLVGVVARLGQQFAGFVEKAEPALTLLGDAVLAVYKAAEPLMNLFVDLTGAFFKLGAELGTTIMEVVLPPVIAITRAFGDLAVWVADALKAILAFFGVKLDERDGTRPNSSVGAAVRPAQIGSIESALQKAMTSAFSLPPGGKPEDRTATATEALRAKAEQMYQEIQGLVTEVKLLPGKIGNYILKIPQMIKEGAEQKVDDFTTGAGDFVNRQSNALGAGNVFSRGEPGFATALGKFAAFQAAQFGGAPPVGPS